VDIDIEIYKIASYPLMLVLMTVLSSTIMFNTKNYSNTSFKIIIGLFFSVIIYYMNNFFNVLGSTEKIPLMISVWAPMIFLSLITLTMLVKINDK
jgi:lipopolysaccharide export system permease protein